jgi:hypothetical protein
MFYFNKIITIIGIHIYFKNDGYRYFLKYYGGSFYDVNTEY